MIKLCTLQCTNDKIVNIIRNSADSFVPKHKANFLKFWWDQELNELKANSVRTYNVWKAAGKPRTRQIFMQRQTAKAAYKLRVRQALKEEKVSYSNDLHDALLAKSGNASGSRGILNVGIIRLLHAK